MTNEEEVHYERVSTAEEYSEKSELEPSFSSENSASSSSSSNRNTRTCFTEDRNTHLASESKIFTITLSADEWLKIAPEDVVYRSSLNCKKGINVVTKYLEGGYGVT